MGVDNDVFYDESRIAIIPMGYCYPGRGRGGDLPPRRECAALWFDQLLTWLPRIELTLLIGQYAQRHFLGNRCKQSLAATVGAWQEYAPHHMPLPHPSPRNQPWFKRHPWFERRLVPVLRARINTLAQIGANDGDVCAFRGGLVASPRGFRRTHRGALKPAPERSP
jgi:uracil-DNA glycosylase